MVEKLMDKELYKTELIVLKTIPYILCLVYMIEILLSWLDVTFTGFMALGCMSVLPLAFIMLSSYVFKFCWKHRLPIYLIILVMIWNIIHSIVIIPMWVYWVYSVCIFIFGLVTLGIGFSAWK